MSLAVNAPQRWVVVLLGVVISAYTVVGSLRLMSKYRRARADSVPHRPGDLFRHRVVFRTTNDRQVRMVLGPCENTREAS